MRFVLGFLILACGFYWLYGNDIVSFDSEQAEYHIGEAIDKIKSMDPEAERKDDTEREVRSVNRDMNKLCGELKEISDRAMRLREKLMENMVDTTDPDKMGRRKSRSYSRK